MTKHAMVTFRLHRNGVILSVILALLFSVLIFAAGYVASNLRRKSPVVSKPAIAAKPDAPKAPPSAPQAAVNSWTIRLGVFGSEEEAKALAARIAKGKLETVLSTAETADGTKLYIVTSGHYAKREDAAVAAAKFDADYGLNAVMISAPPQ
jgi:cell division septation protein DedD